MNFIFLWWKTILHTLALHFHKNIAFTKKQWNSSLRHHVNNVLYAVHSPTQILPTVTCHEFSASLQISQQWFRVHCSVIYEDPNENRLGELGSLYKYYYYYYYCYYYYYVGFCSPYPFALLSYRQLQWSGIYNIQDGFAHLLAVFCNFSNSWPYKTSSHSVILLQNYNERSK